MTTPSRWILQSLFLALLWLTACGGATPAPPPASVAPTPAEAAPTLAEPGMLPEVDPLAVEGNIIVAGSSTVYPLTEAIAERFKEEGFAGNITIDSIGSGAGFERFCVTAETDISNASRAIKDEEREACLAKDRTPLEFRVGTDALAVVVSAENDFVESLTLAQLSQIFSGEAATWQDVDSSFPAEPIQLFSPGTDSGTFDYFVEEVFPEEVENEQELPILSAQNIQFSEDDNVLVQGVEGSPNAIGYFGYAYYQENASRLKILAIEDVVPSLESVENNEYPLSRPLFIYSASSILTQKPQVAAFINFYLTYVGEEIEEVGYFPASEELLDEARQLWLDATP
ncbi:MAG: PstS family phosphate ABC transporter substrate-binding protein [Ardenticatenales bacterium]|nr:PstS family phosphate ABC transporter substrate-binding protein [Ardenticatenales bacterium]